MTDTLFTEPEERGALREAVRKLAGSYGHDYIVGQARKGEKTTELWQDMGRHGYLGVSLPEEHGGGGGGIADLSAVLEEPLVPRCCSWSSRRRSAGR
jgi:alkylation response protein AidB-like acyl-CoA dehydrogenase